MVAACEAADGDRCQAILDLTRGVRAVTRAVQDNDPITEGAMGHGPGGENRRFDQRVTKS
jgi:hypothetical protein